MSGFTIVDAVVAAILLISAILAYSRGVTREIMAILGWIAAAVVGYIFAPQVEPLVREVPVLSKLLAGSCQLSMIAAFAAVFALALVVASIFTPLFSGAVQRSVLGGLDQGLGFLYGAFRGVLLVAVAFVVYNRVIASSAVPMIDNSRSAAIFAQLETSVQAQIPANVPSWITKRYEGLVGSCTATPGKPAATTPGNKAPATAGKAPAA